MFKLLDVSEKKGWIVLTVLLLIEYCLFRTYILRDIVDLHPFGFDQQAYLFESYRRYESILTHGFFKGLKESNLFSLAVSFLFSTQASIVYLFFGASRFTALHINFFYWALLQLVSYKLVSSITKSPALGLMFVGLLLSIDMPFFNAGGLVDFRIDFVAACLYGLLLAVVMRSDVFLDKKWSMVATCLGIWLILMRYFTILYLGGIFIVLLFYYGKQLYTEGSSSTGLNAKIRVKHLLAGACATLLVVSPILWLSRQSIYSYYFVGQSEEKGMNAKALGLDSIIAHIEFYPKVFFTYHAGELILYFAVLVSIGVIISVIKNKITSSNSVLGAEKDLFKGQLIFLISSLIIPLVILMSNFSKSYVVPGILCVPFIWVFFQGYIYASSHIQHKHIKKITISLIPCLFFVSGIGMYASHFMSHDQAIARDDIKESVVMYNAISEYLTAIDSPIPSLVSSDTVADYFGGMVFNTIAYENSGRMVQVYPTEMGGRAFSMNESELIKTMDLTHFFIMNLHDDYPSSIYEFDQSMKNQRSSLKALAEQRFIPLSDHLFDGHYFRVYVKPNFKVRTFGNVTTNENGLILRIPAVVARKASEITIHGEFDMQPHDGADLSAVILNADLTTPLKFDYAIDGQRYTFSFKVPNWDGNDALVVSLKSKDPHSLLQLPTRRQVLLKSSVLISE